MLNKASIISFFLFAYIALANGDNVINEKGASGKPGLLRESRILQKKGNAGAAKATKGSKVCVILQDILINCF